MKSLSPTFLAHVRSGSTTLAFCWLLTLRDGRQMGFTSHDQSLLIEGASYEPQNAISPSAFQQDLSLGADDVELQSVFSTEQVSEQDLLGGRLDGATFLYFLVNWQALPTNLSTSPADYLELSAGRLGGYSADLRTFKAAGLSLIDKLAEKEPIQTSPVCRTNLGDALCKVDLAPYTFTATVAAVTDNRVIRVTGISKPDGYFANGSLTLADGTTAKIATWTSATAELRLYVPLFFPVLPGASAVLVAGCDKRFATCRDKFNNVLNFRGEPSIPGQDVWTSGSPVEGPEDSAQT